MIDFEFERFTKPVAFYPYTSAVRDVIIKIDTWNNHLEKEVSMAEEDLKEFIDDLLLRCDKLNRKVMSEDGDYCVCSTRRDNKTAIAMTDGKVTLYFGKYDLNYYVGFDVWTEFGHRISLEDLERLPKLND